MEKGSVSGPFFIVVALTFRSARGTVRIAFPRSFTAEEEDQMTLAILGSVFFGLVLVGLAVLGVRHTAMFGNKSMQIVALVLAAAAVVTLVGWGGASLYQLATVPPSPEELEERRVAAKNRLVAAECQQRFQEKSVDIMIAAKAVEKRSCLMFDAMDGFVHSLHWDGYGYICTYQNSFDSSHQLGSTPPCNLRRVVGFRCQTPQDLDDLLADCGLLELKPEQE